MRLVSSLLCIAACAMLNFLVVSCIKSTELMVKGQDMQDLSCASAYSTDLVFLSDPIFALHFISDKQTTYSEFYTMALKKQMDARMFVAAEEIGVALLGLEVDTMPKNIRKEFKLLSRHQFTTALRARAVVLSPLMRLFASRQVQRIERYRTKCSLPPIRTLGAGGYAHGKNIVRVRYTQAVQKLAVRIADFMQEKRFKTMVAILDTPAPHNVENMSMLISILKNKVSDFKVRLLWEARNPSSETKSFEQLDLIADHEVVLLHAGMYTSRASQYLRERELVEKERIFAIMDWQHLPYRTENTMSYGIYAFAWVAIPLSALFGNKNYVNAKLYRDL